MEYRNISVRIIQYIIYKELQMQFAQVPWKYWEAMKQ